MTDALMMRLLRSGTLAAPHPLDPLHPCCWTVGEDYGPCSLWCSHDGDHIPYTPGIYLPPPAISPLALLAVQQHRWHDMACPLCGTRADGISWEKPYCIYRDGDGHVSWYEPGDRRGSIERTWRFEPCGCEARELLPALRN